MCKRFDDWSEEIKTFCGSNGYSFEKAKKLSKCWGKDDLVLQYHDPQKGTMGLLDETPMPIVLWIRKGSDGTLHFEQTEYTKRYLA